MASARAWTPSPSSVLTQDRKSTRLNSSHGYISYAVFCLKKKNYNAHVRTNYKTALPACIGRLHQIDNHEKHTNAPYDRPDPRLSQISDAVHTNCNRPST